MRTGTTRCEICGRKAVNSGRLTKARLHAARDLVRGGITDPCQLARLLGVACVTVRQTKIEPMAWQPYKNKDSYDLTGTIRCSGCRGLLTRIPCLLCQMDRKRDVSYTFSGRGVTESEGK